jgi:peptidoglycan hydrolase-like protein with peptidoglycan-binding domain
MIERHRFNTLITIILLTAISGLSPIANLAPTYPVIAAVAQRALIIPDGTVLALRMETALSSETSKVGDPFTATVTQDVTVNNRVAIAAGSKVEGHVTAVEAARRMSKSGTIAVDFDRLRLLDGSTYRIYGELTSLDPEQRKKIEEESRISGGSTRNRSIVFIGGGAGVGAVIGVLSGGGKGAAIGTGVGAAIGTAAVLLSKGQEAEVRPGTEIGLQLVERLDLAASRTGSRRVTTDLSSTESIRRAQRALQDQGYYTSTVDGLLGPRTRAAIRNYQRDNRLPVTGELDERTASQLGVISWTEPTDSQRMDSSSSEMIRRAQRELQNQGYYNGDINGLLDSRTQAAIEDFQHDRRLPVTGQLDDRTIRELGLSSRTDTSTTTSRDGDRAIEIVDASAERLSDNSVRVVMSVETPTGGWRTLGDYSITNDTIHVWARGVPPSGPATQAITRDRVEITVPQAPTFINKVVVHGLRTDRTIDIASAGGSTTRSAASIRDKTADLVDQYQRALDVRTTDGRFIFAARRNYTEDEVALLMALEGLQQMVRLYSELSLSVADQSAQRGAVRVMLRQAREVDQILDRTRSQAADAVARNWPTVRDEFRHIASMYGLEQSDGMFRSDRGR